MDEEPSKARFQIRDADRPIAGCMTWVQYETTVVKVSGISCQTGRVIILNGGSSAGKTTLARTLQSALPKPWLILGIDLLIWTLPPDLIDDPRGLSVREGVITRGDIFMALYTGFQKSVATLVSNGVDVILDDVALDGVADQKRWNDALEGLEVFWIGVRCDPEIAAGREAHRQSRLPGIARHQALAVHSDVQYDIEVDTGHQGLAEEVREIAASLNRRWGLQMSHRTDEHSAPPPISAWTPGEVLHPPPWER